MPTARELLEQADALMRRNRARDSVQRVPAPAPVVDIPVLTDAVEPAAPPRAETRDPAPRGNPPLVAATPSAVQAKAPAPEVPVLTDAVEDIEAAPLIAEAEQGEPSFWLDSPDEDKSVLGVAPDSVAVVPPHELPVRTLAAEVADVVAEAVPELPVAPVIPVPVVVAPPPEPELVEIPVVAPPSAPVEPEVEVVEAAPPPPVTEADFAVASAPPIVAAVPVAAAASFESPAAARLADEERWRQLAEDVRMQVLQRIDMFTDTGLREQLGERLKPIVDRASADLVATINEHVGELLRSYVAEAIEREIERWRHDGER